MQEFIRFYNEKNRGDWTLEIYHSSIMDWCITIKFKITNSKFGDTIIDVQSSDMELAFAQAQVNFKEWLLENHGGY